MEDAYEEIFFSECFIHSFLSGYWVHEINLHVLECLGIIFLIVLPLPS